MIQSKKFMHKVTGEIVTQIPLTKIGQYIEVKEIVREFLKVHEYEEVVFFGEKGAPLLSFTKEEWLCLEEYYQNKYAELAMKIFYN